MSSQCYILEDKKDSLAIVDKIIRDSLRKDDEIMSNHKKMHI